MENNLKQALREDLERKIELTDERIEQLKIKKQNLEKEILALSTKNNHRKDYLEKVYSVEETEVKE